GRQADRHRHRARPRGAVRRGVGAGRGRVRGRRRRRRRVDRAGPALDQGRGRGALAGAAGRALYGSRRARRDERGAGGAPRDRRESRTAAELDPRGRAIAGRHLSPRRPCARARGRERGGRMTAQAGAAPALPDVAVRRDERRIRPGWITIAGKELADHLLSVRLYVLLVILGIAAVIPLYFVGEDVRSAATSASGYPAIFISLFAYPPKGVNFGPLSFTVSAFVAIAAPLLGVAFGFDAVNGERHQGTLPRLL